MRESMVARNYAEALFELGERHAAHETFAQSATILTELLESDRRIRQFLEIPKIDSAAKKQALRNALTGKVPALFLNFVLVVLDHRRQRLLGEIAAAYRALLDEKFGRLQVQVTLAHAADAATEQRIEQELSRILGRAVTTHSTVDPAIIGGIIVRFGDKIMDGSVRRRLATLRARMLAAEFATA